MDRAAALARLATAERHVKLGERHLSRQRELVAYLIRYGRDAAAAEALLATFEQSQALHVADRDRLRDELAEQ
jgi:hypothetical protein